MHNYPKFYPCFDLGDAYSTMRAAGHYDPALMRSQRKI